MIALVALHDVTSASVLGWALGARDTAMPVDVATEIVIRRPLSDVAGFATDPDNVPAWYANIQQVEWITERPIRVGSRLAFVAHFLGRRMAYTYEVVEWVPGERFVMRTAEGPFPMETTYTWQATPSGDTLMRLRNRGEPSGFSRLVAPFMSVAVRSANRKDLARLKAILESRPALEATGSP
jgi:uncharacterized membrane protein